MPKLTLTLLVLSVGVLAGAAHKDSSSCTIPTGCTDADEAALIQKDVLLGQRSSKKSAEQPAKEFEEESLSPDLQTVVEAVDKARADDSVNERHTRIMRDSAALIQSGKDDPVVPEDPLDPDKPKYLQPEDAPRDIHSKNEEDMINKALKDGTFMELLDKVGLKINGSTPVWIGGDGGHYVQVKYNASKTWEKLNASQIQTVKDVMSFADRTKDGWIDPFEMPNYFKALNKIDAEDKDEISASSIPNYLSEADREHLNGQIDLDELATYIYKTDRFDLYEEYVRRKGTWLLPEDEEDESNW